MTSFSEFARKNGFAYEQKQNDINEWYTPSYIIELARDVMGGIDLDPASSIEANLIVKAKKIYTIDDDGLKQKWYGRVWLNPPYTNSKSEKGLLKPKQKGLTGDFIYKLVDEYNNKNISQAILCVNGDFVRKWFQPLWNYTICFSSEPIIFHRPYKESEHHFFGTCFVYLGSNKRIFAEKFSTIGTVVVKLKW